MLARGGETPLVIERDRETGDALCGGFLSWRSLDTLAALGLDRSVLGGHPIDHIRIFSAHAQGSSELPAAAIGISRQRLDTLVLDQAVRCGAAVERGVAVRRAGTGAVELTDGATIACDSLFLATGKHDCRGLLRPRVTGTDPAIGLRMRIPSHPRLRELIGSAIELHVFAGGYAGLLLQEDGSANLCMAVSKSRFAEAGNDFDALLRALATESPRLEERIAFAPPTMPFDAIGAIPYGWRATQTAQGVFRLGDQAAVIPSLAGEGMGIALASGVMAARRHIANGSAGAEGFQTDLARATRFPVTLAGLIGGAFGRATGRRTMPALVNLPGLAAFLARRTRIGPSVY